MSTGFQSNYNDSGYTLSGTWYSQDNSIVTGSISSRDVYTTTELTGVYMINGQYDGSSNVYYPIICSSVDWVNLGIPNNQDDAWLVYPGFGFTLYNDYGYSGTTSRNYVNTSTVPVVYYTGSSGGWVGYGTPILTTSGSTYPQNSTSSVQIYFRGEEIIITFIS
jgi:hypothetical protein